MENKVREWREKESGEMTAGIYIRFYENISVGPFTDFNEAYKEVKKRQSEKGNYHSYTIFELGPTK